MTGTSLQVLPLHEYLGLVDVAQGLVMRDGRVDDGLVFGEQFVRREHLDDIDFVVGFEVIFLAGLLVPEDLVLL